MKKLFSKKYVKIIFLILVIFGIIISTVFVTLKLSNNNNSNKKDSKEETVVKQEEDTTEEKKEESTNDSNEMKTTESSEQSTKSSNSGNNTVSQPNNSVPQTTVVEKTKKEKLVELLQNDGYSCNQGVCSLYGDGYEYIYNLNNKIFYFNINVTTSNATGSAKRTYELNSNTVSDVLTKYYPAYDLTLKTYAIYYGNNNTSSCSCPSCPDGMDSCNLYPSALIDFKNSVDNDLYQVGIYSASDLN